MYYMVVFCLFIFNHGNLGICSMKTQFSFSWTLGCYMLMPKSVLINLSFFNAKDAVPNYFICVANNLIIIRYAYFIIYIPSCKDKCQVLGGELSCRMRCCTTNLDVCGAYSFGKKIG